MTYVDVYTGTSSDLDHQVGHAHLNLKLPSNPNQPQVPSNLLQMTNLDHIRNRMELHTERQTHISKLIGREERGDSLDEIVPITHHPNDQHVHRQRDNNNLLVERNEFVVLFQLWYPNQIQSQP